ncbi:MAG: lysophospholipid acyltransferase family protein [Chloroflexota bacterium]
MSAPIHVPSPRLLTRFSKGVMTAYLRAVHGYEIIGLENLPAKPPLLALTNHVSLLDVPAFAISDPYPDSVFVGKASLMRVPIVGACLRSWGVIPVDRDGQDLAAVREIMQVLREGRMVAAAAEGTRNRQGRLGEVNPVLARLALGTDAPLVSVVAIGTYEALPPGAVFPRPVPIRVVVGPQYDLKHLRSLPKAEATERARQIIRERLVELLPPSMQ